jgi:hypothetical protein
MDKPPEIIDHRRRLIVSAAAVTLAAAELGMKGEFTRPRHPSARSRRSMPVH